MTLHGTVRTSGVCSRAQPAKMVFLFNDRSAEGSLSRINPKRAWLRRSIPSKRSTPMSCKSRLTSRTATSSDSISSHRTAPSWNVQVPSKATANPPTDSLSTSIG